MTKNIYYFILGLLSILFAFTHYQSGQNSTLQQLDTSTISNATRTTLITVWHIITAENLIFGLTFLAMAFSDNMSKVRSTAQLIGTLLMARLTVIIIGVINHNSSDFNSVIYDVIAIIVFVVLVVLGTQVKDEDEERNNMRSTSTN